MKKLLIIFFTFFICLNTLEAGSLNIKAKSAISIESDTLKVLYEKDADSLMAPASMTKMMTLLLLMEAIDNNKIDLEEDVVISKNAASMGGSQIYLEEGKTIKVKDLLVSIAVGSANDSATLVAEKLGGTVDNFVSMMNDKAKSIGALNTTFKNPHGLDEEGHLSTARDMAIIASELVKHEDILKYTSVYETTITHANGKSIWLVNTNSLLKFYKGIDGLKTGYTDKALYCLTATMKRDNMRVITVVMGEESKENRTTDTINLMENAFSNYYKDILVSKNEKLGVLFIDNASNRNVPYYLKSDASAVLNNDIRNITYSYDIDLNNVKAPLKKGSVIGKLTLNYNNNSATIDVVVNEDVKKANFIRRMYNLLSDIVSGNNSIFSN